LIIARATAGERRSSFLIRETDFEAQFPMPHLLDRLATRRRIIGVVVRISMGGRRRRRCDRIGEELARGGEIVAAA